MFGTAREKKRIKFVGYLISRLLFQRTSRYHEDPYPYANVDTHTRVSAYD